MTGFERAVSYLPPRLQAALNAFHDKDSICEIRLRRGLPLSLTSFSGNITIDPEGKPCSLVRAAVATEREISETVTNFCEGSVYRYLTTLREGFLINESGIRLGLCPAGHQVQTQDLPEGYSTISLRIPRQVDGAADGLIRFFRENGLSSTLIISPPGAGKTTLLRDLAVSLASGKTGNAFRVSVIDERRELFPSDQIHGGGLCDIISGIPKARGIEMATRVLSPEVILCDEIGSEGEAESILGAQSGGTYFIATSHGTSLESIKRKPRLNRLLESGIFQTLVILEKEKAETFRSRLTFCRI